MLMRSLWEKDGYSRKTLVSGFGGGMRSAAPEGALKEDQAARAVNLGTWKYPSMAVRPPRKKLSIGAEGTGRNIYHFCTLANGYFAAFYYDYSQEEFVWRNIDLDNVLGTVDGYQPVSSAHFNYNGTSTKGTLLAIGPNKLFATNPLTGETVLLTLPRNSNYIATNGERVFGGSNINNYLYITAKGDYENWTGADSGFLRVESGERGFCTGLRAYNDRILYFTEESMHEVYGNKPENFAVRTISNCVGCVSNNTLCEIDGALYWLGREGVYMYKGGMRPVLVSEAVSDICGKADLTKFVTAPSAGSDGERYYLSLAYKSDMGVPILLVYDTARRVWTAEDNPGFVQFANRDGKMYGMTIIGEIYEFGTSNDSSLPQVAWEWVSKRFLAEEFSLKQSWHKLCLLADVPEGSMIQCGIRSDLCDEYLDLEVRGSGGVWVVEVPREAVSGVRWVQLRLSGAGECVLHGIERRIVFRDGLRN